MTSTANPVSFSGASSLLHNPVFNHLAEVPRWTIVNEQAIPDEEIAASNGIISSAFNEAKVPIDIKHFIEHKRLRGAWATDEQCLVTLKELNQSIPHTSNACFYLRSQIDGYMVIDIEPNCPPEEKVRLLSIPGILYGEASLSGKGYHLLAPLPDNITDYPYASSKRALKNDAMHWEILLEHWVTFTTKPAYWPQGTMPIDNPPTLEQLWSEIAVTAVPSKTVDIPDIEERPEIPHEAELLAQLSHVNYSKNPSDFDDDYSRYEFGYLSHLYYAMQSILRDMEITRQLKPNEIDFSMRAWLLYLSAVQHLEHRPKHDQTRNGYPWLLHQVLRLMAIEAKRENLN